VSELEQVHAALDPALPAIDAVREGYLLHYEHGQRLPTGDKDLQLLAGDAFYALGLAGLAEAGDLVAVAALAELITGCAKAHAEGTPDVAAELWASASR
jgi:hypothetical protein